MKLGFILPQVGPAASGEAIVRVATRAEELGYDSLWVTDRVLFPVAPQTPYPATQDGSLPSVYRNVYDPLLALTFAAANTSRIALGTSVLVMSYRNPLLLAKSLATLDALSGGRLVVGLGQGYSKDEHEALGASLKDRAKRADEVVRVLKAVWTTDPVEFHGDFYDIPKSFVGPKPVQQPHPPVYLAAYTPEAMARVAAVADGWNPAGLPAPVLAESMAGIRAMARDAGRDPDALKMLVRAIVLVTEEPLGADRQIFSGSASQIQADLRAVRDAGADEVILDPSFSPDAESLKGYERSLEELKELADA